MTFNNSPILKLQATGRQPSLLHRPQVQRLDARLVRSEQTNAVRILRCENIGRNANGVRRRHIVQVNGGKDEGTERGDQRQHRGAGRVQPDEGEAVFAHFVARRSPELDEQEAENAGEDEL